MSATPAAEAALTPAQRALLADVRRDGYRVYNGRARTRIEALERAGLVTADWDYNTFRNAWRITVKPASAGDPR